MTDQSKFSIFMEELRRRRVFRVAAFYGGIAFVIVQIIDGTFEVMGIPPWVSRMLILMLGLGFPVAVGLAWIFDITPEGIVRTAGRQRGKPGSGNRALIAVTVLAITFGIWGRWGGAGRDYDPANIRAIAVLPLTNLMGDASQDYFVDGMHEALISNLSRIGALKVISRTSTLGYRNTNKRMPEIARELGVDAIVEGSVLRDGNRIRITAQLISGVNDAHLWSSDYERDLIDIIALQNEVASAIAEEIKITMTPGERARLAERRKILPEAYEWYLRGNDYLRRGSLFVAGREAELQQAINVFQQAIALDPGFAAAHARLSYAYSGLYFSHDLLPEIARDAKAAVDLALKLDPNLSEGYLALGYYYNLVDRNYDAALEAFATAQIGLQGNGALMTEIALVQMRQGNWDQALDNFRKAAELDPRSPDIQMKLANVYLYLRNFEKVDKVLNHLVSLSPDSPGVYALKIQLALLSSGDLDEAQDVLEAAAIYLDPLQVMGLGTQLINRLGFWRFDLLDLSFDNFSSSVSNLHPPPRNQLYYFAMAQLYTQDMQPEKSLAYYDSARIWLEDRLKKNPDNFVLQSDYGLACAFLGLQDSALKAGARAKELMPISKCHW